MKKIFLYTAILLSSTTSLAQTETSSKPVYLVQDSKASNSANPIYVTASSVSGQNIGTETSSSPVSLYQDGFPVGTSKNPLTVNITNLDSQLSDYVTETAFNAEINNLTDYINSSEVTTEANYLKKVDASSTYLPLTGGTIYSSTAGNNPMLLIGPTSANGALVSNGGAIVQTNILKLSEYLTLTGSYKYVNLPSQEYTIMYCSDCYSSSRVSTNTSTGIYIYTTDEITWRDMIGNPVQH